MLRLPTCIPLVETVVDECGMNRMLVHVISHAPTPCIAQWMASPQLARTKSTAACFSACCFGCGRPKHGETMLSRCLPPVLQLLKFVGVLALFEVFPAQSHIVLLLLDGRLLALEFQAFDHTPLVLLAKKAILVDPTNWRHCPPLQRRPRDPGLGQSPPEALRSRKKQKSPLSRKRPALPTQNRNM